MSLIIKNINDKEIDINCLSCAIAQGKIEVVGRVLKTDYFDVHQDQEVPIPGFFIISSLRHITSISSFTDKEAEDFIKLTIKVRTAMSDILDIQEVVIIQKEGNKRHFHLWLFPRYEWMLDVQDFGTTIQSVTPIMNYAKIHMKNPENLEKVNEYAEKMEKALKI